MAKISTTTALAWSLLEQGGTKFVQLVIQIILARILAPEVFGALAIMLVFTNIAETVAQSGLGLALVQRLDAKDKDYTTAFWLSLGIAMVLYILLFVLAPVISDFYNMHDLAVPLRVLAIVVIIGSFNSIQRSYLQRALNFRALFLVNISAAFISGAVAAAMACFGFGLWALVTQVVLQNIVACMVLLVCVPWKPSFVFDRFAARDLFSYGWKICATAILGELYTGISELVIGRVCSAAALGYYSQGRKWPKGAVNILSRGLQNVFFPVFASVQNNKEQFQKSVRRALIDCSFVVVPATLLFTLAAEPLIVLLLTDKWLPAVPVFQLTCISYCVLMFQIVNLRAYMALGHSDLYLKLQVAKVGLGTVAICAAAVLTRDIYVVALVTSLFTIASTLVLDMSPAKRMIGYGWAAQIRDVWPQFVLAGVASIVLLPVLYSALPNLAKLVIEFIVFPTMYLVGAKLFNVNGYSDCAEQVGKLFYKLRRPPA